MLKRLSPEEAQAKFAQGTLRTTELEYRIKCHNCHTFFWQTEMKDGSCPVCGTKEEKFFEKMCLLDHVCTCLSDMIPKIAFCPLCGAAVCPECGSHDVVQISRVTGYLQEVSGWNAGKQQELKDRQRYNIL